MSNNKSCEINETKLSVSMCVYGKDNPEHFHIALRSVLEQTRKPDEMVLVVDGPIPEEIDDIIKLYRDESFFKVIYLPENVGHGNARRTGMKNCSHDLIALMDADDISIRTRFEKQLRCFEQNPEIDVLGGNIAEFIDSPDNTVGLREVPQEDQEIKRYMKKRCPFNQATVMFRRSAVEAAGGYIDWPFEEDYFLWIRMYQNGSVFHNLDDCLAFVRVGRDLYKRRGGLRYFLSEAELQKYMWANGIIGFPRFVQNVVIRFAVQVILPSSVRGYFYQTFARRSVRR